jgi:hypothetical protein
MDPIEAERQLRDLEPIFHRSVPRSSPDVFEQMMTNDYWEVGASGTVYDRDTILAILTRRRTSGQIDPDQLTVTGFQVTALGPKTWLATYQLVQGERLTRRATVWHHHGQRWQAAYHQGTVMGQATSPATATG